VWIKVKWSTSRSGHFTPREGTSLLGKPEIRSGQYGGADKPLARPRRKQANDSVSMAWISFGALPCRKTYLMTARVYMLLKSRASLKCFRASSFLVGLRTYQHPGMRAERSLAAVGVRTPDDPDRGLVNIPIRLSRTVHCLYAAWESELSLTNVNTSPPPTHTHTPTYFINSPQTFTTNTTILAHSLPQLCLFSQPPF